MLRALTVLLLIFALVASAFSAVSWWSYIDANADEYYLLLAVAVAFVALAATLLAWGIKKSVTAYLMLAATVLGWLLFLLVTKSDLLDWSVPVALTACIGGTICVTTVVLIIWRRTRKPQ